MLHDTSDSVPFCPSNIKSAWECYRVSTPGAFYFQLTPHTQIYNITCLIILQIGWVTLSRLSTVILNKKAPGSVTVFPPQALFTFNLLLTHS
jgi:hypothetical protein